MMSMSRTPRFAEADLLLQDVSFDEEDNIHDQLGQPNLVHVSPMKARAACMFSCFSE
jgi:hypothetical protein